MPKLVRQQPQYQNGRLINVAGPERATPHLVRAESLVRAQQAMGNQAMQRFAQSCPLALPRPDLCPFGDICHTCPAQVQAEPTNNERGDKYEQEADRVPEHPYLQAQGMIGNKPPGSELHS